MKKLALKPVEDGEGVTKVAEIRVEGARSIDAARKVAFSVANAQLVRTLFSGRSKFRPYYGGDWLPEGAINSEGLDVLFNGITVAQAGLGIVFEKAAGRSNPAPSVISSEDTARPRKQTASVWTSNLSHEYVRINSAYRT